MLWRQRVPAAALSLTATVGGLVVTAAVEPQPVTTGSFSVSGDPGDYISQGQSWSYSTSNGDAMETVSSSSAWIRITIHGADGRLWWVEFDAPGSPEQPVPGQPAVLAPGTYTEVHAARTIGTGPGLEVSGNNASCGTVTGSFVIINAVFGPGDYVQTFDATFEQHCREPAPTPDVVHITTGEIHISNPPLLPGSAPSPTPESSPLPPIVASGSLSFSGDPGDWISQGKSYSYDVSNGDALYADSQSGRKISISVISYNGDDWSLTFIAPGTQLLSPGTYTSPPHPITQLDNSPSLKLTGMGRACGAVAGSFTIINAVFGPVEGYVQTFDATFEQHCEAGETAARGEVHISNPPAPPESHASPTPESPSSPMAKPVATINPISPPLLLLGAAVVAGGVLLVAGLLVTVGLVLVNRARPGPGHR